MAQQHILVARVQMHPHPPVQQVRKDAVCRRHDELLRQRVENRVVAVLPCLVRSVDGGADAGQVQVVDDVEVAGRVVAVPVDVVDAEAVGNEVSRYISVERSRDERTEAPEFPSIAYHGFVAVK